MDSLCTKPLFNRVTDWVADWVADWVGDNHLLRRFTYNILPVVFILIFAVIFT